MSHHCLMCIVNVASSSCSLAQSMRFILQVCILRVNERVEVVGECVSMFQALRNISLWDRDFWGCMLTRGK